MNRTMHAVRVGVGRGWTEFGQSIRSPQDQGFYLFVAAAVLIYLFLRRDTEVEGTSMLLPSVAMPSILGGLLVFGIVIGPAYSLAMEREDGTLLRARAVPRGILGYVSGQLVYQSLSMLPMLLAILIPGFVLFDDLMQGGAAGWLTTVWVLLLALVAVMPIGIIVGAVVPNVQKVGTWGMMPIMALASISGIFYPVQELWGWVQVVAQIFPMYWLGLGMRSAFLPESAAALEIGGSWRTLETVGVLGAWGIVCLLITPVVVRRMTRRQSGSHIEAARQAAAQFIR